jgi:integrase
VLKWTMRPERGWIDSNAARRVQRLTEPKGRVRYLSDDERGRLLAAARSNPDPRMHLLILLAIATGARESELMRLKWSDIDLAKGLAAFNDTKNGDPKVTLVRGQALEALRSLAMAARYSHLATDHVAGVVERMGGEVPVRTRLRQARSRPWGQLLR